MADTAIAITAGSGTNVDTRTETTNGNHRQVVVLGDPSTNAGVAPVDATAGLKVDLGSDNDISLNSGDNTVGRIKLTDGTDVADVLDLSNSNPLTVAIVDGSGDQITSFGGGTQYTEDAAAAANPVGTALNLVRDDARGGSLTTTDGDNVAVRGTNAGELYVKHVDSVAVTNAGLTALNGAISGAEVQVDVLTMPTVIVTATNLDVQSGGADLATSAQGSGIQTAVELVDDIVYTDDTSTHATGTSKGALFMAAATPTDASVTANDIGAVAMTTDRKLHVSVQDGLPIGTNNIGDVDILSIVPGTGATNLGKAEDSAHTTGDTGVFALSVRNDTPNVTVAANGDYQQVSSDFVGGVRTALYETDFAVLGTKHVKKYYTNAGAVTDGIVWSPAAGARWYVTDIFINVSAAATVTLEDDLAAGDSAIWKAELAANSGWSHSFHTPLFSGEDAADLLITTSAGNCYVTVVGYEI